MSNTNITHVPVLVIGAGAGGVVTSALLAKHGVHSLLVEKRREIFIYPKARNISFRSLEILRGLGVGDEVHAVAAGVSQLYVKPSLNSPEQEPALDIDAIFAPFEGLSPEPPGQYCPQSRLEPILLAESATITLGSLHVGHVDPKRCLRFWLMCQAWIGRVGSWFASGIGWCVPVCWVVGQLSSLKPAALVALVKARLAPTVTWKNALPRMRSC